MRISDLSTWHPFVYTQLYPAVLGSLLYDVLHIPKGIEPLDVVKFSIMIFYCVDWLNLHSDLRSDDPTHANKSDTALDAGVAILLGIAYWLASDSASIPGRLTAAYLLWFLVSLFFLLYYLRGRRRTPKNVWCSLVLSALLATAVCLHRSTTVETWQLVAFGVAPVLWYSAFVLGLINLCLNWIRRIWG